MPAVDRLIDERLGRLKQEGKKGFIVYIGAGDPNLAATRTLAKAFDSHPQTPDRLAKSQKEIQTLLPPEAQYKLDTSEFQEVKSRLAQLQNRLKIKLRMSSLVVAPVISSSGRRAL